ncbi:hypothetical protein V6N11_058588 [Hibiscus sabdariffa]|uniref:Subtilisin-like protease n=1 Tax=Hibiscus sabdariffa TaxID=183260 RepID=A0ABR2U501_9ROSI
MEMVKCFMIVLLLGLCHVSMAAPSGEKKSRRKTYIVHMAKSEMPASFQHHTHWYDSSLKSVSGEAAMLYTYDNVIHGFSTQLTNQEAKQLESQPGILAVLPELRYELHTTRTPEFLGLSRAADLFPETESASEVVIGVLDTGVWPESAGTLDRDFPAFVSLGNGRNYSGVSLYRGSPLPGKMLPFVYAGNASNATNGNLCMMGTLIPEKVAGKIVLCDRGMNARVQKGAVVKAAGGVGMVLANTAANGEELVADAHLLPATAVGQKSGDDIKGYLFSNSNPTVTILFEGTKIRSLARRNFTCDASKSYRVTDLNYPSFAVNFDSVTGGSNVVKHTRTLTNVGSPATYKVSISPETANMGVKISVEPESLSFSQANEKKSYTVTFTGSSQPTNTYSFARLEWSDGKYIVGSPVAISWT